MGKIYRWFMDANGWQSLAVDNDARVMFWLLVFLFVGTAAILIYAISGAIARFRDKRGSRWIEAEGIVIDRQSHPSPLGHRSYSLFVRESSGGPDGDIFIFSTDMQSYFDYHLGDKIDFGKRIGSVSNEVIEWKIIDSQPTTQR